MCAADDEAADEEGMDEDGHVEVGSVLPCAGVGVALEAGVEDVPGRGTSDFRAFGGGPEPCFSCRSSFSRAAERFSIVCTRFTSPIPRFRAVAKRSSAAAACF